MDIVLTCIRWYAAYPLSYRHLEEMMHERGVVVDHSSISRWAIKFLPLLEKIFRKHKRRVGGSWRMDETYIKVDPLLPTYGLNNEHYRRLPYQSGTLVNSQKIGSSDHA